MYVYICTFYLHPKTYRLIDFREGKGERERERNICERETSIQATQSGWPLTCALTRDRTCNLGMCPDQESNKQPFSLQDNTPTD